MTKAKERVLLIGQGGREHALLRALARSKAIEALYCLPGNAGTAQYARNLPGSPLDIPAVLKAAKEHAIDFVAVIPDDPLALGMVDALEEAGFPCFGPRRAAAKLEWSKSFAKEIMAEAKVPTAAYHACESLEACLLAAKNFEAPYVLKADGLAAGKGVSILPDEKALEAAARAFFEKNPQGKLLLEEHLRGAELSYFCFCDAKGLKRLGTAQDYKRLGEGDLGPNTGGMGALSPGVALEESEILAIEARIIRPVLEAMQARQTPFRGLLYCGLMLTEAGPQVIEFNARFGDPETQGLMLRLQSDLYSHMKAVANDRLAEEVLVMDSGHTVTVVMASGGYPGAYEMGFPIEGMEGLTEVQLDLAGAKRVGEHVLTAGGRVLAVTALAKSQEEARKKVYAALGSIHFAKAYYRRDIGGKA